MILVVKYLVHLNVILFITVFIEVTDHNFCRNSELNSSTYGTPVDVYHLQEGPNHAYLW